MRDLTELDFTATIKDFDYTKRAMMNMSKVMDSESFRDMDSDAIFNYLMNEMEIVSFSDYLKRYIFNEAGIEAAFNDIRNEDYIDIIIENFKARGCPFTFTPTTKRNREIVKGWVEKNQVSRESVFILGFGLGMSDSDVSEFLTKVIKEDDFDFSDVREAVFWHCYHTSKGFSDALCLLEYYESLDGGEDNKELLAAIKTSPTVYLANEKSLREYLGIIKEQGLDEMKKQQRLDTFRQIYDRACAIIGSSEDYDVAGEVTPADIERIICSGMPVNNRGNLEKISLSVLADHFQNKRITRQRLVGLLKGQRNIDRFDYITLLMFIYAETVEPDWPIERTIQFIDETNSVLRSVGMGDIYPVNPYEAFVLMCMLTDYPLLAYTDVWEMSYENER